MLRPACALAIAITLLTGASAQAELIAPESVPPLMLGMRTPVPADLTVLVQLCPSDPTAAGCTYDSPTDPRIFIRPGFLDRYTLIGEIGGRFAAVAMSAGARHRFGTLIGVHRKWHASNPGMALVERFGDAYIACALGLHPPPRHEPERNPYWPRAYGYLPTARQHRDVCALVQTVGARRGLTLP